MRDLGYARRLPLSFFSPSLLPVVVVVLPCGCGAWDELDDAAAAAAHAANADA